MSKEAMKLALEALGNSWTEPGNKQYEIEKEAITALREALADQPAQQEPWCMKMNGCKTKCEDCPVEVLPAQQEPAPGYCKHCKQYTIEEPLPAQRIWVGLVWGELPEDGHDHDFLRGATWAEAKLKEKNI